MSCCFKRCCFHQQHYWCHQVLLWKAILKIAPLTHNRYTKYKSNHRQNRFLLSGQNCVYNKIDRKWQAGLWLHPLPSQRALPTPIYAVIVQYLSMHKMNLTHIYWLRFQHKSFSQGFTWFLSMFGCFCNFFHCYMTFLCRKV